MIVSVENAAYHRATSGALSQNTKKEGDEYVAI
jgi:hypothetical protein